MRARSFLLYNQLPIRFLRAFQSMRVRAVQLISFCFCSCFSASTYVFAQTAATATVSPRSHVERFSSPQTLAARSEAEASLKLKTSPNDAEALNVRAYARMGLARYQEAVEDLRK